MRWWTLYRFMAFNILICPRRQRKFGERFRQRALKFAFVRPSMQRSDLILLLPQFLVDHPDCWRPLKPANPSNPAAHHRQAHGAPLEGRRYTSDETLRRQRKCLFDGRLWQCCDVVRGSYRLQFPTNRDHGLSEGLGGGTSRNRQSAPRQYPLLFSGA